MTFVRPISEVEPPDTTTLEGRASLGLKILAVVNGFSVVLAFFPPAVPAARLVTLAFNVASALLVVLFVVEARGLDRLRPWAVAAVRPVLVVIGLAGAYLFVVTTLDGRIRVPFDAAIAIWALLAAPQVTPRPRLEGRSFAMLGGAAVLSLAMLSAHPLFDWGGAIDVRPADLHASMSVDCGTAGADGNVPERITITYDWSWTGSSPLPDGLDGIVLGWAGDDDQGRPLYLLDVGADTEPGVYAGRRDYPSAPMASEIGRQTRGSYYWGIELVQRGYDSGHLVAELRRGQASVTEAEPLTISASYVHLGVWYQEVAPVTCSW